MIKRRYRYSHEQGEWIEVFRFRTDIVVIPGNIRPDGTLHSFTVPLDSPLAEYYMGRGITPIH